MKRLYKNIRTNMPATRKVRTLLCICVTMLGVVQTGCNKLLKIDPPIDKTSSISVYSSSIFAVKAMTGIYYSMMQSYDNGGTGLPLRLGYTADEMNAVYFSGLNVQAYRDQYTDDPGGWGLFGYIYRINQFIDGVNGSATIPAASKNILIGEAKFTRAFCYFYLVNLYGDVPLVTSSDYNNDINVPRIPTATVYAQIVQDLLDAQASLTDDYLSVDLSTPTTEKVRPNKVAATALLARVYLYMGEWAKAETEASLVINNPKYSLLTDLNSVFLKNSDEAIWQTQPNPLGSTTANTADGAFLIPNPGDTPVLEASDDLLAAMEPGDLRRTNWLQDLDDGSGTLYPTPYKYKLGKFQFDQEEYTMVLRLAEQYLIRAEARAQQNNITGGNSAETDVDAIRTRAGLAGTTATSKTDMLTEIAKQRFAELFTEWGDRWLNLKRTGKIDSVMTIDCPLKGGVWDPNKALFPIPSTEFQLNPALHGHQNPGYTQR